MENIFFERPVNGVYERVEALNVTLRERAVGATDRTADRSGFGAVSQEVADRLTDPEFRGYEHRFTPFIAATAAFTLFCIGNLYYLGGNPWLIVAVVVGMFFVEDLYSGVLHIVLDDPRNMDSPLFARGALEFQAHHVMPKDIVRQPFVDVLGDLNMVVVAHLVLLGALTQFQNPLINAMLGFKLLYAWWGQFSHRQAHESENKRAGWVKVLQKMGLLLKPDTHRQHHTHYDRAFTITSGASNIILNNVFKVLPNRHFWAVLFMVMTAFDCIAFAWVLEQAFA